MDVEFNNLSELYHRLEPALKTKEADLKRNDCDNITKNDIWEYLKETKWKKAKDLQLYQMVNDVLHADMDEIIKFTNSRG